MGLTSTPAYFHQKLSVSQMAYIQLKSQVKKNNKDANAQAAAEWLASGSKAKYKSFQQKEQDSVEKKVQAYKEDVYMNALKALKKSWETGHSLAPMPVAGSQAGPRVPAVTVPDKASVNAAAKKAAAKWLEDNKKKATRKAAEKAQEKAKKEEEDKIKKKKEDEKKAAAKAKAIAAAKAKADAAKAKAAKAAKAAEDAVKKATAAGASASTPKPKPKPKPKAKGTGFCQFKIASKGTTNRCNN